MYFPGRIELIFGPMFAGKTTELLRRIKRAELARFQCIIIKYAKDDRYSTDKVSTHDMNTQSAFSTNLLIPCYEMCSKYDVIGVDEGQFFPDIVEFSEKLANNGKVVIIAGLDGTYQRKPFGNLIYLISKCEKITKLTAICTETGSEASFTQRTIKSDEIELIGGANMYRAASRKSFFGINTNGEIHLIIGPVKSGKTTELIRVLFRYKIAKKNPILLYHKKFEPPKDQRVEVKSITQLPSLDELKNYDVIGIDQAECFEYIADWADKIANSGKLVIASAQEGDQNQNAFDPIVKLFPLCERVTKLDSICPFTGGIAPFNVLYNSDMIPISRFALLHINSFLVKIQK
ncbi:thymidine kinase family protein [Histomonas meleagridis]|uniref:thymidine kinase family protein n=1 Tax=Histomonas meleagridis TaxID=135588 RepID=UPI00355AAE0B|nr:thymidine kinase family protein [Histomonas meleagridis]KAH0802597.1 thymidine kinase family protein [Histomonas meleagridis]